METINQILQFIINPKFSGWFAFARVAFIVASALMVGFIIFAPILLFSLITYKMKQEVFKVWAWFSLVFAVLYIYITTTEQGPLDVFSPTIPVTTIFFCILYSILSIIAISIQLFHTRKKN